MWSQHVRTSEDVVPRPSEESSGGRQEKQGRKCSSVGVADSGAAAARTSPVRETRQVGVTGASACELENLCLFQNRLPSLSSVLLPHRYGGPVLSGLLTFLEAQDMHFNGKFPDFYSLRLSRLNLILSANSG